MKEKGRLLTLKEVMERTSMKQSNIYRLMRCNPPRFPVARKLGDRAIRWWEGEVDEYLKTLPMATGTGPGTGPRAKAGVGA